MADMQGGYAASEHPTWLSAAMCSYSCAGLGPADGQQLSEGQRAAVLQAATAPVLVLTGGPGCGKTTTTKHIVSMWHKLGKAVKLCAPTGELVQLVHQHSTLVWLTLHEPGISITPACGCFLTAAITSSRALHLSGTGRHPSACALLNLSQHLQEPTAP